MCSVGALIGCDRLALLRLLLLGCINDYYQKLGICQQENTTTGIEEILYIYGRSGQEVLAV